MSSNLKQQTYRAALTIHQINISVKFPCSVAASIKADNRDTEIHKDFKLLNGNAKIEETVATELRVVYNVRAKMWTETKVIVMVYLKSSSGRIPAGSATIAIKSDRDHQQTKVGIEKCPDKSANIEYSLKLTKIKEQDHLQDPNHSKSTINLYDPSHMPISADIRQSDPQLAKRHMKTEIFSSRVSSAARNNLAVQERQRSEVGSQSQSQSRISKLIMKEHESEVNSQRQKILQLEKQKIKAMKEIRALRHEIETNSLKNSAVSQFQDQTLIIKHESKIESLENEVEKEKNKANQLQNQSHKRKLRIQELEKDIKIVQKKYETLQQELKKQVQQKQQTATKNKQLQLQLRELRQKYQDQLLTHENYIKRSQFKQNVYKQQLKTINQKYTASQSQKQKLLFQKSEIISESQERDKKEKDSYRTRERAMVEEKNRLIRKIDGLEKQLQARDEEKSHFQGYIAELEGNQRKNRGILETKDGQIEELERQVEDLRLALEKESASKKNLEAELLKTDKLDEQKKNFKKLLSQKDQQLSQVNKSKASLETTKRSLTQKLQQLQSQLKQRNASIKSLQKELQTMTKKHQTLKKSQQQKSKQLNDLSFAKQNHETKAHSLYEQLKQLQKRHKAKEAEFTKFTENLHNRISQLEEQNHEVNEKLYGLTQQLNETQKSCAELKSAYQLKLVDLDKLEAELAQSYVNQERLELELQELEIKKAENDQAYQVSAGKFNKRIKELENQVKDYQGRLERSSKNQDDVINKLSNQLKAFQLESKNKDKELYDLKRLADENEAQIVALTSELEHTTLESRHRLKQIQMFKDAVEEAKAETAELEEKLKEMEFELETSKNETRILEDSISAGGKQKQQLLNQIKKVKKEQQKFKSNNQYFLKTFFNFMNQPDTPQVINVNHDDPEIVKSMIEVLKKKKAIKMDYDRNLEELTAFNEDLKGQIQGLGEEVRAREEEVDGLRKELEKMGKEREANERAAEKVKVGLEARVGEKDRIIESLEKDIAELESGGNNLGTIIKQKQQQIEQLSLQLQKSQKQSQSLQQQLTLQTTQSNLQIQTLLQNTQNSISQLKSQLQNLKLKLQAEQTKRKLIAITNEQHIGQIDQMKDQLADVERQRNVLTEDVGRLKEELKAVHEVVREKEEQLAVWEANHNSVVSQLEFSNNEHKDLTQKIINLEIVNKQLHEKMEKIETRNRDQAETIKQKEKQLEEEVRKNEGELKKLNKQLENEKKAKSNVEAKVKQLEGKLAEVEEQATEATREVDILRKRINVLSNQTVGERQKYSKEQENIIKKYEQTVQQKQRQLGQLRVELEETKGQRDFLQTNSANLQKSLEQAQKAHRKELEQARKKQQTLQAQNQTQSSQVHSLRGQLKQLQSSLSQLSRSFESYQLQNNSQLQYLQPISNKLNRLLQDTDEYLKFMLQFQASKNKIIKIGSYKLENYGYRTTGEIVREINVAAQRCKLQIINKAKIPQEDKLAIVEEFKTLQLCIQRVARF